MLPYFAATGHNNYTKSVYVYLQQIESLKEDFPEIYEQFVNGGHCIPRSDRYWAGLHTDLVIEQCLMKSLKSRGGLTRGRGVSENQRNIWLLSAPVIAQINDSLLDLCGISYETSEQHKRDVSYP